MFWEEASEDEQADAAAAAFVSARVPCTFVAEFNFCWPPLRLLDVHMEEND